jgi:carbonic anhydrase
MNAHASSPCVKSRQRVARAMRPACESLEGRLVLSHVSASAIIGSITGKVTNSSTHSGIKGVKVQLFNAQGKVAQTFTTNAVGNYVFYLTKPGAYVVHEVVPKGYVQVTPNTSKTAPVAEPSSSDDAPGGNLPFESPINITAKPINLDTVLAVHYAKSTPTSIINDGHQIQVQYFPASTKDYIVAGGTTSDLAQFHFHDPSETTINGKHAAMEIHFVNTSTAGAVSVVAVFLELGAHNDALDPILSSALAHLTSPNTETTDVSPVDYSELLPTNHSGWFYTGSLTTPPFSQPVNWFVFKTPITLDANQLGEYEQIASQGGFLPNARPVQPLDGRVINQYNYDVNFTGTADVGGQSFSDAI